MRERLDHVSTYLELRPKQVGEHIALNVAVQSVRESRICRNIEASYTACVAIQVHLQAEVLVPVVNQRTTTAIQAVPFRIWAARGEAQIRIIRTDFHPGKLLGPGCYSNEENNSDDNCLFETHMISSLAKRMGAR